MKIALISDAWAPQINGVVRTLMTTTEQARARGHHVEPITPDQFPTVPCPTYPEIRLALGCSAKVSARLDRLAPHAVHIATEGPLGWAARRWCLRGGLPFTTSFHTRFPDYAAMRTGLPAGWFWPLVRRFHGSAAATFAATAALADELRFRGLPQTHLWSRGVDLTAFSGKAAPHPEMLGLARPIQLYVGRIAVEKNVGAFLATQVPGSKVIVGDGPARAALERSHPDARFLGALHGPTLASAYAAADVFVFPSRTDTFGLVMAEALASGLPVAAYPVRGPLDVLGHNAGGDSARIGALDEDLDAAIRVALTADRATCAAAGRRFDWGSCTDQFLAGLRPIACPETARAVGLTARTA